MKQAEERLLELIDYSLHQKGHISNEADTDWDAVYTEASIQTIRTLAAQALPVMLSEFHAEQWKKAEYAQIASYTRYLFGQDELCELFSKNKIPMAILKGAAAAVYYPQPFLRAMGDIDIIVPVSYFAKAKGLLAANGYIQKNDDDGRHVEYVKDDIEVELHHRYSHKDSDVETFIQDGLRHCVDGLIDGHTFPMLPDLANGVVLLEHMCAHLRGGMGLRQLIDWMMYVEAVLSDDFWEGGFREVAEKTKLDALAITATRACQKYLGLSQNITWCSAADDHLCDILIENIISSGNFGQKTGTGNNFERVTTTIIRKGFFGNLQLAGEHNWKALRNHPWLKPFAWFYQIIRYARQVLTVKRGKDALEDMKRGRERYEMLKQLHID